MILRYNGSLIRKSGSVLSLATRYETDYVRMTSYTVGGETPEQGSVSAPWDGNDSTYWRTYIKGFTSNALCWIRFPKNVKIWKWVLKARAFKYQPWETFVHVRLLDKDDTPLDDVTLHPAYTTYTFQRALIDGVYPMDYSLSNEFKLYCYSGSGNNAAAWDATIFTCELYPVL